MSEADTFSSFSIRIGIDGRLVAAFRLATPEWRSGWDAAGNALATEPMEESVFDEASLILRARPRSS